MSAAAASCVSGNTVYMNGRTIILPPGGRQIVVNNVVTVDGKVIDTDKPKHTKPGKFVNSTHSRAIDTAGYRVVGRLVKIVPAEKFHITAVIKRWVQEGRAPKTSPRRPETTPLLDSQPTDPTLPDPITDTELDASKIEDLESCDVVVSVPAGLQGLVLRGEEVTAEGGVCGACVHRDRRLTRPKSPAARSVQSAATPALTKTHVEYNLDTNTTFGSVTIDNSTVGGGLTHRSQSGDLRVKSSTSIGDVVAVRTMSGDVRRQGSWRKN